MHIPAIIYFARQDKFENLYFTVDRQDAHKLDAAISRFCPPPPHSSSDLERAEYLAAHKLPRLGNLYKISFATLGGPELSTDGKLDIEKIKEKYLYTILEISSRHFKGKTYVNLRATFLSPHIEEWQTACQSL